ALMMYYLVGAAFSPISGWLGDRYGPRRMMLLASVLYGSSMIILGLANQPWQFFLAFSVMLSLTQSISMVPLQAAINGWFRRRLGLGTGILWAAGGIGSAILAPLVSYLVGHLGWQATFWTIGAIGGGTMLLLIPLFHNRPADLGLQPYGATQDDPPEVARNKAAERLRVKVFNQHVRRTKAFWNLPVIHGLGCAGHGIVLSYSIAIAHDRGISLGTAAIILSLISICSVGSRFITPIVAERFGGKPVMAAALFIQGITVLALFGAHDVWTFYLFAIFFGIGFGGEMSAYLVVNRQYFGTGPIATTYGFQIMGALGGHAVSTGLAGLVIATTGSYIPALVLSMVFSFVGVLAIMTLESSRRVLISDWEKSLPPEARTVPVGSAVAAD
ncbi:MAG: MFS transporter, partial [Chloroflexota bacterium]